MLVYKLLFVWFVAVVATIASIAPRAGATVTPRQPAPRAAVAQCLCENVHTVVGISCTPGCTTTITHEDYNGGTCLVENESCGSSFTRCRGTVDYVLSGTCSGTKQLSCQAGCGHPCASEDTCMRLTINCADCTYIP